MTRVGASASEKERLTCGERPLNRRVVRRPEGWVALRAPWTCRGPHPFGGASPRGRGEIRRRDCCCATTGAESITLSCIYGHGPGRRQRARPGFFSGHSICTARAAAENTVTPELASVERLTRRLRAVLFVDVVDSVRLIQHDQEGTIQRWRKFTSDVSADDLTRFRGRLVKMQGDGMLLEFESAVDAVECAIAMQARIERGEAGIPREQRIRLRMGVHLADVIVDDIDLYGDGVNLAARLRDLGGPEEIVISAAIRDHLTNGLGVTLEDLGERPLKGIARPVRAFRVWPSSLLPHPAADRPRRTGGRPSIAVLPFRNLSGDPAHNFLGDLIAEAVIGDLSRLTDLFVISRLSTTPFRDRLYEPRNVADVLGVRYVLSGTIQTSGMRTRLMAELTEAELGHVIWSERFDGSLGDIFELQDRLSQEMAKRVVPFVRQLELERTRFKRPEDLTAYERTLRAIDHMHRSSREDLDHARTMLEAAILAEPEYVAPRAWLAHWYVRRVGQGWSPDPQQDRIEANRYAASALDLDDKDPWALSVYGLVAAYLNKDLETAIARYDRALTINPSAAFALGVEHVGPCLAGARRGSGSTVADGDRAVALRPQHVQFHVDRRYRACGGRPVREGDRALSPLAARKPDVRVDAPHPRHFARALGSRGRSRAPPPATCSSSSRR